MKAKIETTISKDVGGIDANNSAIFNQVRSVNASDEFDVSAVKFFEYEVSFSDIGLFQIALADIVEDTTKISAIVVFAFQQVEEDTDYPLPVKFRYNLGLVDIVSSQFAIVNCEETDLSELIFSEFQVATDKKATFTIAITYR
jgi:hypothetical protein